MKLPALETFPLDLFKQYYFVLFSYIYLTVSCQNVGVGLGLGIGLVPFLELFYFLDSIGIGLEKNFLIFRFYLTLSERPTGAKEEVKRPTRSRGLDF